MKSRKHIMLPDMQVTPDSPTDHLSWIGEYIVEQKPDVIVNIGDFADMESLSSYDKGKKCFEGRRYQSDVMAARNAMEVLMEPLKRYNAKQLQTKHKRYLPELYLTLGNHEYRINRAIESDAILDGTISVDDLGYEDFGWEVYPFLDMVEIDGITYSHYFCNQMNGRPVGGASMDTRLKNIGFSFTMGHQQILLTGIKSLNNGSRIRGAVCGSGYLHDEDYRGAQANSEWRGILVKHECRHGDYDLMEVSLDYLCRRYENIPLWKFMKKKYPRIFENSTFYKRQEVLSK